jgi:hypothetical protein
LTPPLDASYCRLVSAQGAYSAKEPVRGSAGDEVGEVPWALPYVSGRESWAMRNRREPET